MQRWTSIGWHWVGALGLLLAPVHSAYAVPADDFNDNVRGATWTEIEDNAALLSVNETNQRLEAVSSKTSAFDLDALYLSDGPSGFALSANADFQMRVSYDIGATLALAQTSGSDWRFALDFGFGTTANGDDSFAAAVAWAPFPIGGAPFRATGAAYRVDDVQSPLAPITAFAPQTGTIYLSYDAAGDTIHVSDAGYGAANADYSLPGLVQGQWDADTLLVAIGARGHGVDIAPGFAWLDDFVVDAGTVVPVPEPTTAAAAALALGVLAATGRRPRATAFSGGV
jgi:hypothetical protein